MPIDNKSHDKENLITDDDRNSLAFLGSPCTGKSVIITLLRASIFKNQQIHEKYRIRMIWGYKYLEEMSDEIYSGKFPVTTPEFHHAKLTFEIRSIATTKKLIIRDIAGEKFNEFFLTADMTKDVLIENILNAGDENILDDEESADDESVESADDESVESADDESVDSADDESVDSADDEYLDSSFTYLINPKMYIIVIDCKEYEKWESLDTKYGHIMHNLSELAKYNGNTEIKTPIAIVLSKYDLISEKIKDKSPKELIEDKMVQFSNDLSDLDEPPEYFKLHLDITNKSRIKLPISYSTEEYQKLINWILKHT